MVVVVVVDNSVVWVAGSKPSNDRGAIASIECTQSR